MDKERISRLINFEDEGMDTSTGYVDMRPDTVISEFLNLLGLLKKCLDEKDDVGFLEHCETFIVSLCERFGSEVSDKDYGENFLVYSFKPSRDIIFYETEKWAEKIKGIWCIDGPDIGSDNGIILTYRNSKTPFYKRLTPMFNPVNRYKSYSRKNAVEIYEYFKLILQHIRFHG